MALVLVVYDTLYGHSAEIAGFIERKIGDRGHTFEHEAGPGTHCTFIDDYAAVIVIAPIHRERHPASIERFVRQHARYLSSRPTAFVSVSLGAAARLRSARKAVQRVAERLFEACAWRPSHLLYTGGSIDYPIYTPSMRRWMRAAAFFLGLPTDTTCRHDLTNWERVGDAVDAVLDDVETARLLRPHADAAPALRLHRRPT